MSATRRAPCPIFSKWRGIDLLYRLQGTLEVDTGPIKPRNDNEVDLGTSASEFKNLYIDGKAYIDGLGENILVDTNKQIQFRDSALYIYSSADGLLDLVADTRIQLNADEVRQIKDSNNYVKFTVAADGALTIAPVTEDKTGYAGDIVLTPAAAGSNSSAGVIDVSGVAAGNPVFKITATSDTPSVTWSSANNIAASAAPAGYLEIDVGGNSRYIPFWA